MIIGPSITPVASNRPASKFTRRSILLNGSDEYLNADSIVGDLASDTAGTWIAWVKPVDGTPSANECILSFNDTNANENITLRNKTNGTMDAACRVAGVNQWALDTDSIVFTNGDWVMVALVQDGASPLLYLNDKVSASTFTVGTDKTLWMAACTGLDNGRIGSRNFNNGGETLHYNGNITDVQFYNVALDADAITDIYNNGVPKDESGRAGLVRYYRIGDSSQDNYNSGVANEWEFSDETGSSDKVSSVNCDEVNVENDAPSN